MDDADSNLGFFARGSLVAALVIVGVVASARGGVAALSSASMGGGQMYFVRVRGIFAILPDGGSLLLLCWFLVLCLVVDTDGCMIDQKISVWRHDGVYVIRVSVILTCAGWTALITW